MTDPLRVILEVGKKRRVVAGAMDWPGLDRWGTSEDAAVEVLSTKNASFLKPTLMKKVSPVVQRVCRRHGIPYTRTTFLEVQVSLQEHFARMGTLADVRASADDSRK